MRIFFARTNQFYTRLNPKKASAGPSWELFYLPNASLRYSRTESSKIVAGKISNGCQSIETHGQPVNSSKKIESGKKLPQWLSGFFNDTRAEKLFCELLF
jgi:hypothetical protein